MADFGVFPIFGELWPSFGKWKHRKLYIIGKVSLSSIQITNY
jgi:hypothetical protein